MLNSISLGKEANVKKNMIDRFHRIPETASKLEKNLKLPPFELEIK